MRRRIRRSSPRVTATHAIAPRPPIVAMPASIHGQLAAAATSASGDGIAAAGGAASMIHAAARVLGVGWARTA